MFQSVLRFQRLLYFASDRVGRLGLADLAMKAGYADQSHMTREIGRFAGKSPSELLASTGCTLRLADFLAPRDSGEFIDTAA